MRKCRHGTTSRTGWNIFIKTFFVIKAQFKLNFYLNYFISIKMAIEKDGVHFFYFGDFEISF